jgi:hypothetical protein
MLSRQVWEPASAPHQNRVQNGPAVQGPRIRGRLPPHLIFVTVVAWSLLQNVLVRWLTFLLRTREVPGSNLGPETGYPDWGISWLSSVPPGKCRNSPVNSPTTSSVHIVFSSSFTCHPLIWRCIIRATEKALLNKLQINKVILINRNSFTLPLFLPIKIRVETGLSLINCHGQKKQKVRYNFLRVICIN